MISSWISASLNVPNAIIATKSTIGIYNNKKLHLSLDFQTPNRVFNNEVKIYFLTIALFVGRDIRKRQHKLYNPIIIL